MRTTSENRVKTRREKRTNNARTTSANPPANYELRGAPLWGNRNGENRKPRDAGATDGTNNNTTPHTTSKLDSRWRFAVMCEARGLSGLQRKWVEEVGCEACGQMPEPSRIEIEFEGVWGE